MEIEAAVFERFECLGHLGQRDTKPKRLLSWTGIDGLAVDTVIFLAIIG